MQRELAHSPKLCRSRFPCPSLVRYLVIVAAYSLRPREKLAGSRVGGQEGHYSVAGVLSQEARARQETLRLSLLHRRMRSACESLRLGLNPHCSFSQSLTCCMVTPSYPTWYDVTNYEIC